MLSLHLTDITDDSSGSPRVFPLSRRWSGLLGAQTMPRRNPVTGVQIHRRLPVPRKRTLSHDITTHWYTLIQLISRVYLLRLYHRRLRRHGYKNTTRVHTRAERKKEKKEKNNNNERRTFTETWNKPLDCAWCMMLILPLSRLEQQTGGFSSQIVVKHSATSTYSRENTRGDDESRSCSTPNVTVTKVLLTNDLI